MVQPTTTTADRQVGVVVQAYVDGVLKPVILPGTIWLNPDGSIPESGPPSSAQFPATLGPQTAANSLSVVPATDARFVLANSGGVASGLPTYQATATGYAAYATPTTLMTITGSATKTVIVTGFAISAAATAATVGAYYFIKRSTANAGGTSSALSAVPFDSDNAAATATVRTYTVAPTPGTAVGNLAIMTGGIVAVATSAPLPVGIGSTISGGPNTATAFPVGLMANSMIQPIVLRGTGEVLELNFNGAALPAGFTSSVMVQWAEYS